MESRRVGKVQTCDKPSFEKLDSGSVRGDEPQAKLKYLFMARKIIALRRPIVTQN